MVLTPSASLPGVYPHHERAIETFVNQVEKEGVFDAVIVAGSIAKGTARESSDLDVYIVVGDDDYRGRKAANDLAYIAACDYMDRTRELLAASTPELFSGYFQMMSAFTDWGIPEPAVLTRFMELDEWLWLDSGPELSQR
jgi:hypothetical protein